MRRLDDHEGSGRLPSKLHRLDYSIQPARGCYVVELIEEKETKTGLLLPDGTKGTGPQRAYVRRVGAAPYVPGVGPVELQHKVGDEIALRPEAESAPSWAEDGKYMVLVVDMLILGSVRRA